MPFQYKLSLNVQYASWYGAYKENARFSCQLPFNFDFGMSSALST